MSESSSFYNSLKIQKLLSGLLAGGVASLLTQPMEVIKTIILINPQKSQIIEKGYNLKSFKEASFFIYNYKKRGFSNFFQGGQVAIIRQALGFATYSFLIEELNKFFQKDALQPKYYLYSVSAGIAKIIAVSITSPLILIKTRFELITNNDYHSIIEAITKISKEESYPSLFKGITSVLSRELTFSIFHYSLYKYFLTKYGRESNFKLFVQGYFASFIAIFFSHPFEVVRNRIMIQDKYLVEEKKYSGVILGIKKIIKNEGISGFFKGIIPRMVRKPLNSSIVWSIYEIRKRNLKVE